jgi:hypothetical protein
MNFPILARTIWVFGKLLFDRSLVYTADSTGLPGQGALQQDDDQIPLSPELRGPEPEVTDQSPVFVLVQEVSYGFFDFGIGKLFGDILGVSMQGEKVVKLPKGP